MDAVCVSLRVCVCVCRCVYEDVQFLEDIAAAAAAAATIFPKYFNSSGRMTIVFPFSKTSIVYHIHCKSKM